MDPPTVYRQSKVAAEKLVGGISKHWIFRVSVLFGPGKTNFVERCLRSLQNGEKYVVALDQIGSANYTLDAAPTLLEVCEKGPAGTGDVMILNQVLYPSALQPHDVWLHFYSIQL